MRHTLKSEMKFDAGIADDRLVMSCCDEPEPPAAPVNTYGPEMAAIAKRQQDFAERQYEESKPRQQALYELAQQVMGTQLQDSATARERSDTAWGDWNTYGRGQLLPTVVGEAMQYGGTADQQMQAGRAVADINAQLSSQRGQSMRTAASMGKKYANLPGDDVRAAGLAASAATNARMGARDRGIALRAGALSGLQGQQNVAGQNLGLGTNAGSAGLSSANTGFMSGIPYAGLQNQGYAGAYTGLQGAGGLANQTYAAQMQGYGAELNQPSMFGTLAGAGAQLGGAYMMSAAL